MQEGQGDTHEVTSRPWLDRATGTTGAGQETGGASMPTTTPVFHCIDRERARLSAGAHKITEGRTDRIKENGKNLNEVLSTDTIQSIFPRTMQFQNEMSN